MKLADWLDPRLAVAPPELAGAIRELLREADVAASTGAEAIPDALAAAALRGIDGVARDGAPPDRQSRAAAFRLLAADAALTYAFEAAADLGTDVVALALRLGPRGALGRRLAAGAGTTAEAPGTEVT